MMKMIVFIIIGSSSRGILYILTFELTNRSTLKLQYI